MSQVVAPRSLAQAAEPKRQRTGAVSRSRGTGAFPEVSGPRGAFWSAAVFCRSETLTNDLSRRLARLRRSLAKFSSCPSAYVPLTQHAAECHGHRQPRSVQGHLDTTPRCMNWMLTFDRPLKFIDQSRRSAANPACVLVHTPPCSHHAERHTLMDSWAVGDCPVDLGGGAGIRRRGCRRSVSLGSGAQGRDHGRDGLELADASR